MLVGKRRIGLLLTKMSYLSVTRMQFYVYEIARNRRGLNEWVFEKAQEEVSESDSYKRCRVLTTLSLKGKEEEGQ